MAGILEMVNDRREYFQSLRNNDGEKYVKAMQSGTERLARQVGANQHSASERMMRALGIQDKWAGERSRNQQAQANKHQQANRVMGERQISSMKNVSYTLGNDIRSMEGNLGGLMKEMLVTLKKIERQGQGPGLLDSALDMLGDGRRRGRRGPRRPGARARARAIKAARGGTPTGGRRPPPLPKSGARPPPLPKAGIAGRASNVLGAVRNTGGGILQRAGQAGGSLMSRGAQAAGSVFQSAKGLGSRALGAVGMRGGGAAAGAVEAGAARAVGTGLLRKAGAAGAIAAGGLTAYQALKDDTKTDGEKAQAVANVAGGTAGALALGSAGAQAGAALGTMIFPGVGTAIGGAVGGIGGGALGYFGGEKIIDTIGTSISGAVEKSGIGDHIGRGVSLFMSPFSEDAREALKSDWKNNILPSVNKAFDGFKNVVGNLGGTLMEFGSSLWEGAKNVFSKATDMALAPAKAIVGGIMNYGGKAVTALENSGSVGKAIVGGGRAAASAVASALPPSISGALGFIAAKYESGGRGVATVSTGRGDHGGVSYGKHQLATNNGSMAKFLASKEGAKYGAQFAGLKPGSAEFNAKYKQIVESDGAGMEKAQHDYIVDTHYNPLARKVASDTGLDVNKRGRAVQEAIMSTSVQYGGGTSVFTQALKGRDASKMTDEEIVNAVQDYKAATVNTRFKSSSEKVRAGVARRIENERRDLLAVAAADKGKAGTVAAAADGEKGKAEVAATTPKATFDGVTASVDSTANKPKAEPTATMSPTMTANAASPSASTATAAVQTPVQKVSPSAPIETKPVAIVADTTIQPEKPAPTVPAAAVAAAQPRAGGIDLNDIPVFFPHLSMVPTLIGRV